MNKSDIRYNQMFEKFKLGGYKLTPQRIAILKILSQRYDHPRPEDIYEELKKNFPTTSPATVYKTLLVLKDLKEVFVIQYNQNSNRYDGVNPEPHPHICCKFCNEIIDVDNSVFNHLKEEITDLSGYIIEDIKLEMTGICPKCQK